jgi:predicted secreted protein
MDRKNDQRLSRSSLVVKKVYGSDAVRDKDAATLFVCEVAARQSEGSTSLRIIAIVCRTWIL